MALQIIWTDIAEEHLNEILYYWISRNRSTAYAIKLNELLEKAIQILSRYPNSGRKTNHKNLRVKIVRDYFVYYHYDEEYLYVTAICDMRREPESITELLE